MSSIGILSAYVNERPSSDALSWDRDGLHYIREFEITADSKPRALDLLKQAGIARNVRYVDYDGSVPDPFVVCQRINVRPFNRELVGGGGLFIAKAYYGKNNTSSSSGGSQIELLPNNRAHFWIETGEVSVRADLDSNGDPIVNSAGIPFDPPVSYPEPTEFLIAEWIVSGLSFVEAAIYSRRFRGKTNSREWRGADAREIMCHSLVPSALEDNMYGGSGLIKYKARFEFRNTKPNSDKKYVPGFTHTLLDLSRMEINPDFNVVAAIGPKNRKWRTIKIQNGPNEEEVSVSSPVLLDGKGVVAKPDKEGRIKPSTLEFKVIPEIDFNELKIK